MATRFTPDDLTAAEAAGGWGGGRFGKVRGDVMTQLGNTRYFMKKHLGFQQITLVLMILQSSQTGKLQEIGWKSLV